MGKGDVLVGYANEKHVVGSAHHNPLDVPTRTESALERVVAMRQSRVYREQPMKWHGEDGNIGKVIEAEKDNSTRAWMKVFATDCEKREQKGLELAYPQRKVSGFPTEGKIVYAVHVWHSREERFQRDSYERRRPGPRASSDAATSNPVRRRPEWRGRSRALPIVSSSAA